MMTLEIIEETISNLRRVVALQLWKLGAIRVELNKPFRLVSGNYSPIYINCRQLISSPSFVDLFAASTRLLFEHHSVNFDVVAGGETAGIPFAAFLARSFAVPLVYVRKAQKRHGILSRIEGVLSSNTRVLLVEDLITDAGSKMSFIEAIREAACVVEDTVVVFDRLQGGREALLAESVTLHSITDTTIALGVGKELGLLSQQDFESIETYLASPHDWHTQHGLSFNE